MDAALPSGLVTFMFTDVEGSTRSWAADPEAMSASLGVHDQIMRSAIADHGGYVFTTAGDSFAVAFTRASDAVGAATRIQTELDRAEWPGPALRVRMGLHLGEAHERDGDYFGPVVNTTARVEAAGHGGQVLITDAVRAAAHVTGTTDLGPVLLRDHTEPMRLHQLGNHTFAPLRVIDPDLTNLPVPRSRLLGRDDEVLRIRKSLGEHRLVTITAGGGAGKTRIALEIGDAELQHCTDGVWFVDLARVAHEEEVPMAVCQAVGLDLGTGDVTDQLVGFCRDKQLLLVLDNCEHVVEAAADLADALLADRSPARMLATSREALDVEGEVVHVLAPLDAGGSDAPAVRLFLDRATALDADLHYDPDELATVAELCRRLDGSPLGIELAAARSLVMRPAELLDGLDDRFRLLSGGRRRNKQRTLEATLAWSYELLDDEEQSVLRSLGVFADGFDLDAVAAVAGVPLSVAVDLLDSLIAKSLVVRVERAEPTRFRLLETVKAYAEDRLVDAGEAEKVRSRHLDHFADRTDEGGRTILGRAGHARRLRADRANLSAAAEWGTASGRLDAAGRLLAGTYVAYEQHAAWGELEGLIDRWLERLGDGDVDTRTRDEVVVVRMLCRLNSAQIDAVVGSYPEIDALATPEARLIGLALFAYVLAYPGEAADTIARCEALRAELVEQGETAVSGAAGAALTVARAVNTSDWDTDAAVSHPLWAEAAEAARAADLTIAQGIAVTSHGLCQVIDGQAADALVTIEGVDDLGVPRITSDEVRALAYLALDDVDAAADAIQRSCASALTGRVPTSQFLSLALMSAWCLHEGDRDRALELLLECRFYREPAGQLLCHHLGRQLGAEQRVRDQMMASWPPTPEMLELHRHGGLDVLRAEMARRGLR